jgi:hypothetical protein
MPSWPVMTTAPYVPTPPQGPGVHPPFPAPPVEGKGKRVGMALGIAAGVLVVICGFGGIALVGLGTSAQGAMDERAQAAVRGYLDALQNRDYARAYDMLCDQAREDESAAEFRSRIAEEPVITDYQLGAFNLVELSVPVDATFEDGQTDQLDALLAQDTSTGAFEVCELTE